MLPASQHTSPSWKRKLSAPTLRDSTSQNLNTSLGKTRLEAWQSRLGLSSLQPCPQVELLKSTAMYRCTNKWVQVLINDCRCAKVPPITWSPERNSGSNSSLITGNKAWVVHQSKNPKQPNQTKNSQPQKTYSTAKKLGLVCIHWTWIKAKQNKNLIHYYIHSISSSMRKAEQDEEAGANGRC